MTASTSVVAMNFQKLYSYRFQGIDLQKKMAVWRPIAEKIFVAMGKPQVVLDPAGGQLEFIQHIPARERWVIDMVEYESIGLHQNIKFMKSSIFDAQLPDHYFEGVFVSNFLEHLMTYHDIAALLSKLSLAMKTGGRIAIMGPNYKYCYKSYFDFADHVLPLSHLAVMEHLAASGFKIELVWDRFLPLSFRSRLPASPWLTRLYLNMPLAWKILGKQFLIIASKT
ncbi:methyltransferase domain-containing protein [Oligoflexus tunisiensis]|uniref:methyltransferase domain-containing protein n=1 Tax=Oligoflexus tunisiensis TaxID=708132 RepID=UPI00114D35AB|nr:class I SAM-dependent methyltransferase [Oligoflexus tunisiensis]